MLRVAFLVGLVSTATTAQDSQPLWRSPTRGAPVALDYAPQGSQFHAVLRPARIQHDPQSQLVIKALGPEFQNWWSNWFERRQLLAKDVEQWQASIIARNGRLISVSVITLFPRKQFSQNWRPSSRTKSATGTYYDLPETGEIAWVPSEEGGTSRLAVVGLPQLVEEIAQRESPQVALRRQIEQLRRRTDAERSLTVLASSQFFRSHGRRMPALVQRLLKATDRLWSRGVQALSLSTFLDADSEFYFELEWVGDYEFRGMRQSLKTTMQDWVKNSATYAARDSRLAELANRWPAMTKMASQNLRVAQRDDLLTANVSLPPSAAHNLVLGSHLLLRGETNLATMAKDVVTPDLQPRGLTEQALMGVLRTKAELRFDQQSFEFAVRDLQSTVRDTSEEAQSFLIEFDGQALREAGITRNQQISNFAMEAESVARILSHLVRLADPQIAGGESKNASERLVWCLKKPAKSQEGGATVLITTAKVAKKKAYRIPRDLRNK